MGRLMASMTLSETVDALLASKDRVVEGFYDRLLTQFPELSRFFEHSDLRMQASMLTMALVHVEGYYSHRFAATRHYLQVLGHRHYHLGVRPEDFRKFHAAMLETLAEFLADDWTTELKETWCSAMDLAISVMLEGYQQDFTF
jgi:hemoglobin-like flavoprotein